MSSLSLLNSSGVMPFFDLIRCFFVRYFSDTHRDRYHVAIFPTKNPMKSLHTLLKSLMISLHVQLKSPMIFLHMIHKFSMQNSVKYMLNLIINLLQKSEKLRRVYQKGAENLID